MTTTTIPIRISWKPRWDKSDRHFYFGKNWEASVKRLDGRRVEIYSTRIQFGPFRIILGGFVNEEFEQLGGE